MEIPYNSINFTQLARFFGPALVMLHVILSNFDRINILPRVGRAIYLGLNVRVRPER